MPTTHDKLRDENIRRNKAILDELGLDTPLIEPKQQPQPKKKPAAVSSKKRRADTDTEEETDAPAKAARVKEPASGSGGPRRSARNAGKKIDYNGELDRSVPDPVSVKARRERDPTLGDAATPGDRRVHDPKVFGAIPGVEVGTWWESRMDCSKAAIHAPVVAGISGDQKKGAWSVALSGGYEDDVDRGYAFTYTGSGGRDLKGTKTNPKNLRTAPQSSDQTFDNPMNAALKKSAETRKPVRVIRGFKLKSRYAPFEGYRYDGLYIVEKAWTEKGLNPKGYLVCKFAFKRIDNQPPIPVRYQEGENPEEAQAEETEDNDNVGETDERSEHDIPASEDGTTNSEPVVEASSEGD